MIDKIEKNPHFSPILKWKHPSIWQLFWCDRKLPFDDYELYRPPYLGTASSSALIKNKQTNVTIENIGGNAPSSIIY